MTSAALEQLAAAVEGAKPIPLTGQIRVDVEDLNALIDQARAELPQAEPVLERLRALLGAGLQIPLTDQVRIDRRTAKKLLKEARAVV